MVPGFRNRRIEKQRQSHRQRYGKGDGKIKTGTYGIIAIQLKIRFPFCHVIKGGELISGQSFVHDFFYFFLVKIRDLDRWRCLIGLEFPHSEPACANINAARTDTTLTACGKRHVFGA